MAEAILANSLRSVSISFRKDISEVRVRTVNSP